MVPMFRQLPGVHSISIRGAASGSLCRVEVTMPKLEPSHWYDVACDINWSFHYFTGRGVSRGPEHASSNLEDETYMAERYMQLHFLWE
jgi:hypothetical protein